MELMSYLMITTLAGIVYITKNKAAGYEGISNC